MITSQKLSKAISNITLTNIYIVNQEPEHSNTPNSLYFRVTGDAEATMRFSQRLIKRQLSRNHPFSTHNIDDFLISNYTPDN